MNSRRLLIILIGIALALIAATGGMAAYYILAPSGSPVNITGHNGTQGTGTPGASGTQTNPPVTAYGNGCGVKKNSDGTFTFSWLHVSQDGQMVDEKNCKVPLVGFNMGGLFLGDGGGNASLDKIRWYKQAFPMNAVRVNFNTRWWVDDVNVPTAHMHFRQWLETYVNWQKQVGNYVILDKGPHFAEPPCDHVTITLCPSQDQGNKDYQKNPNADTAKGLETYIGYDVQAWTDLAKLYANDPAVIYDAWNEPTAGPITSYFQQMNTLINTIRTQNPRSLIIVYSRGYKDIADGVYPNYTQPNLVIDAHVYPKFNGTSPATGQDCHSPGKDNWTPQNSNLDKDVQFAHSHGQAFIIDEWGGCYDEPNYHQLITSYAKAQGIGLQYFQAGNVVVDSKAKSLQINDNGRLVQQAYASILGTATNT